MKTVTKLRGRAEVSLAEAEQIGEILRIEQQFATELARSTLISECVPRADGWLDINSVEAAGREEVADAVTYLKYRKLLVIHPDNSSLVCVLP